jgi:hypothetical protein
MSKHSAKPANRGPAPASVDREALLAALVLAPATYSRNRFFDLYRDPELYRIRRRASQIRSIVRHVTRVDPAERGDIVSIQPAAGDRVELTYAVHALGLVRTALLDPIEVALVRYAIARAGGGTAPLGDPDRARIEAALARLAPTGAPV